MSKENGTLSMWTVVLLVLIPTFGFGNITNNIVAIGPASVPSWIIVTLCFFLPLSLFIAELATAKDAGSAGMYTWIKVGIGEKWAFLGTWSYFVSTLFYLQMVFARIPVMVSWVIFGENRFSDSSTYMIPVLSVVLCIFLTWVASTGVQKFSKLSDIGGKVILAVTVLFIVFAFLGVLIGKPAATHLTVENLTPTFDTSYFATFAWLLLAVAGAEAAGTYVKEMEEPRKFPKAVIIASIFIGAAYIIGSVAVLMVSTPEAIEEAGVKDAVYVVYQELAEEFGLNGGIAVRLYALAFTISSVAGYIVWMESPLRALFSEVPEGTFPKFLTKADKNGTMKNALWTQCIVVIILIIIPLFGLGGLDALFNMLTDLSALSSVPAYLLLTISYFAFRYKKKETNHKIFQSNKTALPLAALAIFLAVLGYVGAGLDYIVTGGSAFEAIMAILKTYGGPILLILVGWILRCWSLNHYKREKQI